MERSTHDIFQYCTGAIDGLAITLRGPSNSEDEIELTAILLRTIVTISIFFVTINIK